MVDETAPEEHPDLWVGKCTTCSLSFQFTDLELMTMYPELGNVIIDGDEFGAECPCGNNVLMHCTTVKAVPFSAWQMMPPSGGCPQCAREHPSQLPHDRNSLAYQYWFRLNESKAGRPERWPTWADAMAHCTQQVKDEWARALRQRGATV